MAKSSISFDKKTQPKERPARGKSFLTKVLDTMQANAIAGAAPSMNKEQVESIYINQFITRAFNPDDPASSALMGRLLDKSYKSLKPVMEEVRFTLPATAKTPTQKAQAILKAISNGDIPPDVGVMLISAAKSLIDIEMATDIKERLDKLEAMNGLN